MFTRPVVRSALRTPHSALLLAVLAVAVLSAAVYAQVRPPVNPDDPITMTKGMYADLLCVAASEFDASMGGFQFCYDPATDTVRATHLPPSKSNASEGRFAAGNLEIRKTALKARAEFRMQQVLPKLQHSTSPAATSAFVGF